MFLITEASFSWDPTTSVRVAPLGAANATSLQEVETERPDPFQQTVQGGLIKFAANDGDVAAGCHVQADESRGGSLVELARNADLVGGLGSHQGPLPRRAGCSGNSCMSLPGEHGGGF